MSVGAKRALIVIAIALTITTGLGTTLIARVTGQDLPASVAPSSSTVPASAAQALSASSQGAAASQGQIDILRLKLSEAWNKGDWNQAIDILNRMLAIQPADAALREQLYQAHVNLGWALVVGQKFPEAKAQFDLALQVKPLGTEAMEGLRVLQQFLVLTPVPVTCSPTPALNTPTPLPCTPTPPPPTICPTQAALAAGCLPCQLTVPAGFVCHVVRTGDTLFSLARRFHTTVEAIVVANRLKDCRIFVCQSLLIPVCPPNIPTVCPTPLPTCIPVCPTVCSPACLPVPVRIHVVQRGDSLFRLALRFNSSVSLIMQANGLQTTQLRVGQRLVIP